MHILSTYISPRTPEASMVSIFDLAILLEGVTLPKRDQPFWDQAVTRELES